MRALTLVAAITLASASAHAHGGGLDANGCHTESATGDYHCHQSSGGDSRGLSQQETALLIGAVVVGGLTMLTLPLIGVIAFSVIGPESKTPKPDYLSFNAE